MDERAEQDNGVAVATATYAVGGGDKPSEAQRTKAHQRLRLRRTRLAAVNYTSIGVYTLYLHLSGQLIVTPLTLAGIFVVLACVNGLFFILIATGNNLRFQDPSMTGAQLTVASLTMFVLFATGKTIFSQDLFYTCFLLSLLFGSFRLNLKQVLMASLPGMAGFAAILLLRHGALDEPLQAAMARAGIYFGLSGWVIFFVSYINRLRAKLNERNQSLKQALSRIEELAVKDALTGAYSRRLMHEMLEHEIERARRTGEAFSVCLLDLDHFKSINDTYGHLCGDAVLCEVVKRIEDSVRSSDELGQVSNHNTVSRFGGEEFLLILPMTEVAGARTCAERIRESVRSRPFDTPAGPVGVSVSIGMAEYRKGDGVETLIGRVDEALYLAKRSGRDRVEMVIAADNERQPLAPASV